MFTFWKNRANDRLARTSAKRQGSRSLANLAPDEVKSVVDGYTAIHNAGLESRKEHYQSLINHYYDLVTDFYEFGWGQSFHFAPGAEARASRRPCSGTSIISPNGCP